MISDEIVSISNIKHPITNFESCITNLDNNYVSHDIIYYNYYVCTSEVKICTRDLIKKYNIVYDERISHIVSKDLFDHGNITIYNYQIIKMYTSYSIELNIKNQKDYYARPETYQESHMDQCKSIACRNGGKCTHDNTYNYFKCICDPGYFGLSCENKYSCGYCENNKCDKNKKCFNCNPGYKGEYCEQTVCDSLEMCSDHGECNEQNGKRTCICNEGWMGEYCHIERCKSNKNCLNGAQCINRNGNDVCLCSKEYEGDLCNINKNIEKENIDKLNKKPIEKLPELPIKKPEDKLTDNSTIKHIEIFTEKSTFISKDISKIILLSVLGSLVIFTILNTFYFIVLKIKYHRNKVKKLNESYEDNLENNKLCSLYEDINAINKGNFKNISKSISKESNKIQDDII